jgi:hypothetical protein
MIINTENVITVRIDCVMGFGRWYDVVDVVFEDGAAVELRLLIVQGLGGRYFATVKTRRHELKATSYINLGYYQLSHVFTLIRAV